LYSIVVDAFCGKFYLIWLLQKVIKLSYNKHDYVQDEEADRKTKLCRCISPLYLMIPFAAVLTILHWIMLAIVGVRIYVDNFSVEKSNSKYEIEPITGSYASTAFTRFMIACTTYLPIALYVVYIILNKHWFYEVFSVIKQSSASEVEVESIPPSIKFLSFVVDPSCCICFGYLSNSVIYILHGWSIPT